MSTPLRRTGILLALIVATGCSRTLRDPERPRVDRNVLTHEQVVETRMTNAYEAVYALRFNWLLPRGIDSFSTPGQVLVYFNDTRLGGVQSLQSIGLADIGYIRYYDGNEASARWGLDHGHGVIYVATLTPR